MKFFKINTAGTNRNKTMLCKKISLSNDLIDFASNDYLGFSQSAIIFKDRQYLIKNNEKAATGSQFYLGTGRCFRKQKLLISIKPKQR
jgi:8-amino-7-oxononanoate synthase